MILLRKKYHGQPVTNSLVPNIIRQKQRNLLFKSNPMFRLHRNQKNIQQNGDNYNIINVIV